MVGLVEGAEAVVGLAEVVDLADLAVEVAVEVERAEAGKIKERERTGNARMVAPGVRSRSYN